MKIRKIGPHLPRLQHKRFFMVLEDVRQDSRFDQTKKLMQHGTTSVMSHSVNVAYTAYYIAYKLGIKVNQYNLVRGALLHDYFLYDWHEKCLANTIHGFTHPRKAYNQAKKDFNLTPIEKDMILHHMFPLTIFPPKTKEGIILCLADKLCASRETIKGRMK